MVEGGRDGRVILLSIGGQASGDFGAIRISYTKIQHRAREGVAAYLVGQIHENLGCRHVNRGNECTSSGDGGRARGDGDGERERERERERESLSSILQLSHSVELAEWLCVLAPTAEMANCVGPRSINKCAVACRVLFGCSCHCQHRGNERVYLGAEFASNHRR